MNIKERIKTEANNKISNLIHEKYSKPNGISKRTVNRKVVLYLSLSLLMLVSIIPLSIIGKSFFSSKPNDNSSFQSNHEPANSIIKPWSDRNICQKYPVFMYKDYYYSISSEYDYQFPKEKVGTMLIDSFALSSTDYQTNKTHQETVSLFSIENIDTRSALLVKFANQEDYYPYCCVDAYFDTIGILLSSYDLYNQISFNDSFAVYKNKNNLSRYDFSFLDKNIVWELIFNNPDLINKTNEIKEINIKEEQQIDLCFSIPLLGIKGTPNMGPYIKLYPTSNYVFLNILDVSFLFKAEDNGANNLFLYLVNNMIDEKE